MKRWVWPPEVVTQDSGSEVRNQRWSRPKRSFELSFPPSLRDGAPYLAVIEMFEDTEGGNHTFDFVDWTDETDATVVKVRFDSDLQLTGITTTLDHIDTFTIVEVFE